MKKRGYQWLSGCLLVCILLCGMGGFSVSRAETAFTGELHTKALLLLNMSDNSVLFEQDADAKLPCASTTKIMTYLVVRDEVKDMAHEMVTILQEPIDRISNRGASTAGFENRVGEQNSVSDLVKGMLIASGCEAAEELAFHVSKGNPDAFVEKMNKKAASLGCSATHYVDAHGLGDGNVTTARELAIITRYALQDATFKELVGREYEKAAGISKPFINTNLLIDEFNGGGYYYPYATGGKTGYTYAAGKCLVTTAKKGETELLSVALGGAYAAGDGYVNHAMTDTIALLEYGFSVIGETVALTGEGTVKSIGVGETVPLKVRAAGKNELSLTWTALDPAVAMVDAAGNVTGVGRGETTVVATAPTGDQLRTRVTVGYYNGLDVTEGNADRIDGKNAPVNWKAVAAYGMDFAVIGAGSVKREDRRFGENLRGAAEAGLPAAVKFTATAATEKEAAQEGEKALAILLENRVSTVLPVIYDLSESDYRSFSAAKIAAIAKAYAGALLVGGYRTAIFAGRSAMNEMDPAFLRESGLLLYVNYCPYQVDFKTIPAVDSVTPQLWKYRSDGYLPAASTEEGKTAFLLLDREALTLPEKPEEPEEEKTSGETSETSEEQTSDLPSGGEVTSEQPAKPAQPTEPENPAKKLLDRQTLFVILWVSGGCTVVGLVTLFLLLRRRKRRQTQSE